MELLRQLEIAGVISGMKAKQYFSILYWAGRDKELLTFAATTTK